MKLVFFGTPQFAVPSLETLLSQAGFELLAVVTQPDKRRGRGNELSASPVKSTALAYCLPVWQPARIKKDAETLENLRQLGADAFVVVAYGQILSPEILAMPRLGCINGHGSLLPKYRGAAPIQWSLYHGETETGITTMQMDAGMDTGPMLLKASTPIHLLDNALDLAGRLSQMTADLLIETGTGERHEELTHVRGQAHRRLAVVRFGPGKQLQVKAAQQDARVTGSRGGLSVHSRAALPQQQGLAVTQP
jgi:methionyl-tRNA formyltransferase